MNISRSTWLIFTVSAAISLFIWYIYTYPQLAFVNFSVDRPQALSIAKNYLKKRGVNPEEFKTAITYGTDGQANRYLQKNIGFDGLKKFVKEHDFDLFFWIVRFFKEGEKEEYRLTVSSETGEVIALKHSIEETAKREEIDKETAKTKAVAFLKESFGFETKGYKLKGDLSNVYDNRTDYSFTWEKEEAKIPWSDEQDSGNGRLLRGATVSGTEILSFSKNTFSIPEKFNRYLEEKRNIGANLLTIIKNFYIALVIATVFFIVTRRNHLAMHNTKKFYLGIMITAVILLLAEKINFFQDVLFNYQTTSPFFESLARYANNALLSAVFASIIIIIPSLSGELLHLEAFKHKKEGAFLYYLQTTFFSRHVAQCIFMGYLVAVILFGIQSLVIKLGQNYLGVWTEYAWMGQQSSAYLPFLAAFTIGFRASFSEEIMYRLFAISWGKKIFKNTVLAVVAASLIWGFAHSTYPVFPMWFRGVEVTILGLFISFIYLRFGIISVIVAHYLFDVFWSSSGYILGHTQPIFYFSSLFVLLMPFFFALIAFIIDKPIEERPMKWHLGKHQKYNLEILKSYLVQRKNEFSGRPVENIKKEILSHGWDVAVVDVAVDEFTNNTGS